MFWVETVTLTTDSIGDNSMLIYESNSELLFTCTDTFFHILNKFQLPW